MLPITWLYCLFSIQIQMTWSYVAGGVVKSVDPQGFLALTGSQADSPTASSASRKDDTTRRRIMRGTVEFADVDVNVRERVFEVFASGA